MANLKEIRNRIVSISSTRQITSAMKMVSAAKLRRAQDAITQMRPYSKKLQEILENLSSGLDSTDGVYSQEREVKNVLFVSITANRGLCGGFNNNVIKTIRRIAESEYKGCNITVVSVGKKSVDSFKSSPWSSKGRELFSKSIEIVDNLTFDNAAELAQILMDEFAARNLDKVVLVYNQFKNAAVQEIQAEQFLPIVPTQNTNDKASSTDYIFEPNKEFIVQELIPKSLKTQLFKALLDSRASEHGARMTAMHKATDNATDLINALKLSYNKARQAAITNEILEIVAGAEALK
ncbi:MAG: ATP synthase F1 subunit gamma [Flavobacteriales bacterium]|nr:MAG: ATP synthase F1 subunit gamma [Flavobacteriales bacterium]MBX2960244.1 ATP synthase F1 subunit gamma [Flavobacteriales bacterium]